MPYLPMVTFSGSKGNLLEKIALNIPNSNCIKFDESLSYFLIVPCIQEKLLS